MFTFKLFRMLQYGIAHTVGVFFAIFVEEFPGSSGAVAFISSLNTAVFYGAGPLVSILTNFFGCRVITIIGGVIACIGMATSMYATNIYHLYVTFGIITGFGLGLAYLPSITIITCYVDRWRSVAIGVAASGVGLGQFVYPPLIRFLVHEFGWRGAVLILGGISLHICIFGVLFKPVAVQNTGDKLSVEISNEIRHCDSSENKAHLVPHCATDTNIENGSISTHSSTHANHVYYIQMTENNNVQNKHKEPNVRGKKTIEGLSKVENRKEFHSSAEIMVLSHIQQDISENIAAKSHKTSFLNMLKNPTYILLCMNSFGVCFGMSVVYIHLAAYSASKGIDDYKSALLYTAMGISNFIGRFSLGLISQTKCVQNLTLYVIILGFAGVATCVCPVYSSYYWLLCFAVIYGFCTASVGPLIIEVIMDVVGEENITSGYGYLLIFEASGVLLGAPVAGWLYDWTDVYDSSLFLSGTVTVISSCMMIIPAAVKLVKGSILFWHYFIL